jgi:hypothetical protein
MIVIDNSPITGDSRHYRLDRIFTTGKDRLRVVIDRDFYNTQSLATVSVWRDRWEQVAAINGLDPQMVALPPTTRFGQSSMDPAVLAQIDPVVDEVVQRLLTVALQVIDTP